MKRAIAAPDRIDLLPISDGAKPNRCLPPWSRHVFLMSSNVSFCVINFALLPGQFIAHNGVSLFAFLTKPFTLCTALPNRRTGQSSKSFVLRCVLDSHFSLFF